MNMTTVPSNQLKAMQHQLAAQELVIQQLRDALEHAAAGYGMHLDSVLLFNLVKKALAIPNSTDHLEAWYREMVGPVISAYPRDGLWEPLHAIKPFKGE